MRIRTRGFSLKLKLLKIFKWRSKNSNPFSKVLGLARVKTPSYCGGSGYVRMGRVSPPKGYLAVHVGGPEDETERHLVPVLYFNHPMFGKLLDAAERIYGFHYPGRIMIPCHVSEFEEVKRCIAAAENFSRRRLRRLPASALLEVEGII